jgi:hypothetical protein
MLIFVFGLYRYKPALDSAINLPPCCGGTILEVASNRHFYNLIDYVTLDSQTAWYIEHGCSRLQHPICQSFGWLVSAHNGLTIGGKY